MFDQREGKVAPAAPNYSLIKEEFSANWTPYIYIYLRLVMNQEKSSYTKCKSVITITYTFLIYNPYF